MNRRAIAVALLLTAFLLLAWGDRPSKGVSSDEPGRASPRALAPVAAPNAALSSTWFCAGGTATDDGAADHSVVIANPNAKQVDVTVTAYPGTLDGDPKAEEIAGQGTKASEFTVAPRTSAAVRLADVAPAPFSAAVVEASGGAVVVEHKHTGSSDQAAAPCSSSASDTWYFATGATTRGATEQLAIFNPFPEDAVVDLTFATFEGFRTPQPYRGYIVPRGRLVVLDITPVVARHPQVASAIVTRSGRLIVDRIQRFDGAEGVPKGMDVTLGVPEPRPLWYFPDGQTSDGLAEVYTLFNPGEDEAEVDLEVALDDPKANGEVEPIEVTVPPQQAVQVEMHKETRLPKGIGHSVTARSVNDVPVVIERWFRGTEPNFRRGVAYSAGSPVVATQWVFAVGAASEAVGELLVVQNPSPDVTARVQVKSLGAGPPGPVPGLDALEVPPGGRLTIEVGKHLTGDDLPLLVEATTPVVAERTLFRLGQSGLAQALGVPLFEGVEVPSP